MQFFVVATKHNFLITCCAIRNISKYLGASSVNLIVPGCDKELFQKAKTISKNLQIFAETAFSPHIRLDRIRTWSVKGFPQRANWYYQQFLKLSVAENPMSEDRFVIWDGDTIPYRPMRFFDTNGPIFTVHNKEFHLPYFETNARLIGVDRRLLGPQVSAVSQHMPVVKSVMLQMLRAIESEHGLQWPLAVRDALKGRADKSLFSEYELYFDYARERSQIHCGQVRRPWFRYGTSCSIDQRIYLSCASAFVAYEPWDRKKRFRLRSWLKRWQEIVVSRAEKSEGERVTA
jgi:hypothetical protein